MEKTGKTSAPRSRRSRSPKAPRRRAVTTPPGVDDLEPLGGLDSLTSGFAATDNPAFAWEAIAQCHAFALPFPDWLREYLLRTASRFCLLSRTPPSDPAIEVFRALGFSSKRGHNPFRAVDDYLHDHAIARDVWKRLRQGEKFENAIADAASAHARTCVKLPACANISKATVARSWRAHRAQLPTILKRVPRA